MNDVFKFIIILVIVNIFLYVGVNFSISADGDHALNKDYKFYFKGDLIDQLFGGYNNMDTLAQDTKEGWTSYGINFNSNITKPEKTGGVSTGQGGINFIDTINVIWGFILLLSNIIMSPLALFFNFNMPFFIGLLIGVPYAIILLLTFFGFIRGA